MRILLAEDDTSQADSIKTWLEMDGYSVDWVERGDHAILALEQHQYECILLDRGLPKVTGDEILKRIVQLHPLTPVLFITARDSIADRVEGLDLGAHDYLVKPFSLEELSARVRAQLRLHHQQRDNCLTFGDLCLDVQAKMLRKNTELITLTSREYQILHKMMLNPEHIMTRSQLEESLYAWGDEVESNAIEVFIYQLRKKIGSDYIKTLRGLGYRMNLPQQS
ncbi:response regulator transcription factor [Acinetobacter sp. SH20PTE14]|uniref:response regulator transcription factor n=1 Tax=Acinetobacter sp. SH20PTE14 TaxID=2905879 RepID=UPI001F1CA706|nr:response regulator transcription factor [Acinetobacter sp. SH20PTE14]UIJ74799.1 response regulator transcription factor [Acinetobacter sp. SH20PTE14]